jgi:hypothetical protein
MGARVCVCVCECLFACLIIVLNFSQAHTYFSTHIYTQCPMHGSQSSTTPPPVSTSATMPAMASPVSLLKSRGRHQDAQVLRAHSLLHTTHTTDTTHNHTHTALPSAHDSNTQGASGSTLTSIGAHVDEAKAFLRAASAEKGSETAKGE